MAIFLCEKTAFAQTVEHKHLIFNRINCHKIFNTGVAG